MRDRTQRFLNDYLYTFPTLSHVGTCLCNRQFTVLEHCLERADSPHALQDSFFTHASNI